MLAAPSDRTTWVPPQLASLVTWVLGYKWPFQGAGVNDFRFQEPLVFPITYLGPLGLPPTYSPFSGNNFPEAQFFGAELHRL